MSTSIPNTASGHARARTVALWTLQTVTAIAIFSAGAATVAGAAQPAEIFDQIGLDDGFRYLTGALQLAGAIALLLPGLAGAAGLAFVGMWLTAVATHLFAIGGNPTPALVFLVLTAAVAWARRDETSTLFARLVAPKY